MKSLKNIAKFGLIALLGAGIAGCGSITGKVVNVTGKIVPFIESYYGISSSCENLEDASNELIQSCRNFSSHIALEPGDYTIQVKAEDGTLYSLDIVDNSEGTTLNCPDSYPTIGEMVSLHMGTIVLHNVKFPDKDRFNKFNVGDFYWCELKFFEDGE